jgi:hypothetical protein
MVKVFESLNSNAECESRANLNSNAECESRANTFLYQLKDAPKQAEVMVNGTNNILVGDRIPLTILSEGISADNFDVIQVENFMVNEGWTTKATMVNSYNIRKPLVITQRDMIKSIAGQISNLIGVKY